jgi:hypothetical protein
MPSEPRTTMMRRPGAYMGPPSDGASPQEVENLATWIKGCMERAQVSHFELKQRAASDMTAAKLSEWFSEDIENKDPQQISEAIMNEAHKDAENQRGTTRYVVLAFRSGDPNNFARTSFRLPGGMSHSNDDQETELPNEAGLISQMMRHTEASIRMALQGNAEVVRSLSQQLAESNRQVNKLASMQYTVLELQQTMLDRQAERDLAVRHADSEDKRKQQVFERLSMLFPILLKKITGEGKSIEALLGEDQISAVLEGLDQEQLTKMLTIFEPAQQAAFLSLYDMYRKRRKRLVDGESKDEDKKKDDKGGDKK